MGMGRWNAGYPSPMKGWEADEDGNNEKVELYQLPTK